MELDRTVKYDFSSKESLIRMLLLHNFKKIQMENLMGRIILILNKIEKNLSLL